MAAHTYSRAINEGVVSSWASALRAPPRQSRSQRRLSAVLFVSAATPPLPHRSAAGNRRPSPRFERGAGAHLRTNSGQHAVQYSCLPARVRLPWGCRGGGREAFWILFPQPRSHTSLRRRPAAAPRHHTTPGRGAREGSLLLRRHLLHFGVWEPRVSGRGFGPPRCGAGRPSVQGDSVMVSCILEAGAVSMRRQYDQHSLR